MTSPIMMRSIAANEPSPDELQGQAAPRDDRRQKAIQFHASIPRYLISRALRAAHRPICWSALSCVRYGDVPTPPLPAPDWVRVRVRLGGICGSDLHLILLHNSPSSSVFSTFPFTIGHENVGVVAEAGPAVPDFPPGTRVVVEPILPCAARGVEPACSACRRGDRNLCENFATRGTIGAGLLIGACGDTGGSWAESFVAHRSQLLRVPEQVSDENALMVEPFAAALHPVLRNRPDHDARVLIIGGGVIGLCAIAALRALGSRCQIVALVSHEHQAELARRYGADVVVRRRGDYASELAAKFDAQLRKPLIGPPVVIGGADYTLECAGSASAADDALRFTRSGGHVVLVGLASFLPGVDWTPVWLNELRVHGSFTYGDEQFDGRAVSTCQLALDFLAAGRVDLAPLVTHRFALSDYRRAIDTVLSKHRSGVVKAAFAFD